MLSVNEDWEAFTNDTITNYNCNSKHIEKSNSSNSFIFSNLYISTQTKIAHLNIDYMIDLYKLFWSIEILDYHIPKEGIVKKQMKFTSTTNEQINTIKDKLKKENVSSSYVLINVNHKNKIKHVQKVNIGICKKDIISFRIKEKSVFYNCFVMVFRIKENDIFKEIHVKLFNTGKMEIPGIQNNDTLLKTLHLLVKLLAPYFKTNIDFSRNISTVLINSNFNCGYFINREKIYSILRDTYNIISLYDPCSYPGIQCKFYYNYEKKIQNGRCNCSIRCSKKKKGKCLEISFMIFRTGSILIVGHCDENVIHEIYIFLKSVFNTHFDTINEGKHNSLDKCKNSRKIKKYIYLDKH